jgi:hypothetical protein
MTAAKAPSMQARIVTRATVKVRLLWTARKARMITQRTKAVAIAIAIVGVPVWAGGKVKVKVWSRP